MRRDDRIRLQHMLDAAREALRFVEGRSQADLEQDRMLGFAVLKALEIIGEAAGKVSVEGRALLPDLPWPDMVGIRHRLVHAYFDIDYERVWVTVRDDLKPLADLLERFLAGPQPS